MNTLTTTDTDRHRYEGQPLQKKNKKNAPARKNSIAYAHCTHLPLPAITQSQPEGKVKRVQSATLCFVEPENVSCDYRNINKQ
jgi:hypothetical protein